MLLDRFKNYKYICLHGIKITDCLKIILKNNIAIILVPYEIFIKMNVYEKIINISDIVKCDIVVMLDNCFNNTLEIKMIKSAISLLYFADRMRISSLEHKKHNNEYKMFFENIGASDMDLNPIFLYNDYFENYYIDGFRENGNIRHASWFVNIGKNPLSNDNFERWLTRAYGSDLNELYNRRDGLEHVIQLNDIQIDVSNNLKKYVNLISSKIIKKDLYANKIMSSLILYYNLLCDFQNPEQNDISFCTILETLLLGKDEDNQRKKAACRAACIIANGLSINHKKFVANNVYYFYKYRNSIVHDGMNIIDFDETIHRAVYQSIKHVVFCLIKYIIYNDVKSINQIKKIVQQNITADKLENAFDYIDYKKIDNGEPIDIINFNN